MLQSSGGRRRARRIVSLGYTQIEHVAGTQNPSRYSFLRTSETPEKEGLEPSETNRGRPAILSLWDEGAEILNDGQGRGT